MINLMRKIEKIISLLKKYLQAVLFEAGTPLISDPGFKLITDLISLEIKIIPLGCNFSN